MAPSSPAASTTSPVIFSRQNTTGATGTPVAAARAPASPIYATEDDGDSSNPITSVSPSAPPGSPAPPSRATALSASGGGGGGGKRAGRSVFETICCCLWSSSAGDGSDFSRADAMLAHDSEMRRRQQPLLGEIDADDRGKKCLVLDLDETLVHSSFRAMPNADYIIPVRIDNVTHQVYVAKRPGVDEFLKRMAAAYEVVVYTASLNKYADPLIDMLDPSHYVRSRLFRPQCIFYRGNYVKDLASLNRDLRHTIIVDNSPSSYIFQPENAIDTTSFIDDPDDNELATIGGFLETIQHVDDVRAHLKHWRKGAQYVPAAAAPPPASVAVPSDGDK